MYPGKIYFTGPSGSNGQRGSAGPPGKMANVVQQGWKVKEAARVSEDHQGILVLTDTVGEMEIQVKDSNNIHTVSELLSGCKNFILFVIHNMQDQDPIVSFNSLFM